MKIEIRKIECDHSIYFRNILKREIFLIIRRRKLRLNILEKNFYSFTSLSKTKCIFVSLKCTSKNQFFSFLICFIFIFKSTDLSFAANNLKIDLQNNKLSNIDINFPSEKYCVNNIDNSNSSMQAYHQSFNPQAYSNGAAAAVAAAAYYQHHNPANYVIPPQYSMADGFNYNNNNVLPPGTAVALANAAGGQRSGNGSDRKNVG